MNLVNNIILVTQGIFSYFKRDPVFVGGTPQNLMTEIENYKNEIFNIEEIENSLVRIGTFNAFTYLNNINLDKNYNYSLLSGVKYNGKTRYDIVMRGKNDFSPIDMNQLHENFKQLPESTEILDKYNAYLRFIKYQNDGIDKNNEFPKGGLFKLIQTFYPLKYNGKVINVDI